MGHRPSVPGLTAAKHGALPDDLRSPRFEAVIRVVVQTTSGYVGPRGVVAIGASAEAEEALSALALQAPVAGNLRGFSSVENWPTSTAWPPWRSTSPSHPAAGISRTLSPTASVSISPRWVASPWTSVTTPKMVCGAVIPPSHPGTTYQTRMLEHCPRPHTDFDSFQLLRQADLGRSATR